jgi:hypothetical protein
MGQYTAQQVDLVAGAVAGVFLRKFPNCVMPTEEVLEAIQSVIGEETHSGREETLSEVKELAGDAYDPPPDSADYTEGFNDCLAAIDGGP